jgi:hypothetical protein
MHHLQILKAVNTPLTELCIQYLYSSKLLLLNPQIQKEEKHVSTNTYANKSTFT